LIEYAFDDAKIDSVYGGCYEDNIASYKVQVKVKMILYKFDKENGDPHFYIDKDIYYKVKNLK
jgi:RimJ/RimL family protein N-acetyltransferase